MLHNYYHMNPMDRFNTMNQPYQNHLFTNNHLQNHTIRREEPLYDTRYSNNYLFKNNDNYYLNKNDDFSTNWINKPKNYLDY